MKRVYRYRDIEITSVHKAKYVHITVNWYCHFNNKASSESHCAACVRCIMQVTGAAVVHVNQYQCSNKALTFGSNTLQERIQFINVAVILTDQKLQKKQ